MNNRGWSLRAQFIVRSASVVATVRLIDPTKEETAVPFIIYTRDVVRVVKETVLFPPQIGECWISAEVTVEDCLFSIGEKDLFGGVNHFGFD